MPSLDPDRRTRQAPIACDPPNPVDPLPGYRFHTRCPYAEPVRSARVPRLTATGDKDHSAACLMADPTCGHSKAASAKPMETVNG